jgi:hypothetical protein
MSSSQYLSFTDDSSALHFTGREKSMNINIAVDTGDTIHSNHFVMTRNQAVLLRLFLDRYLADTSNNPT